jgi:hypothetical protein
MFDGVAVDGFNCLAHRGEQRFGQAAEEQMPDQVDMARGGFDEGAPGPRSGLALVRLFPARHPVPRDAEAWLSGSLQR